MAGKALAMLLGAVLATCAAGCSTTSIPPTYTQDELRAICQRNSGYWRPDGLAGGSCEFRGP